MRIKKTNNGLIKKQRKKKTKTKNKKKNKTKNEEITGKKEKISKKKR